MIEYIPLVMLMTVMGLLMLGYPAAFTLAGSSLVFAGLGWGMGFFNLSYLYALPSRIYGNVMTNEVLLAVPLFVFMGIMLERSGLAETLLEAIGKFFAHSRHGIGLAVTLVGMLLAATTGVVGATVVMMGLISLPIMLKHGYDKRLASGLICAAGTLGQIIPPSLVLVILADQIGNAYVEAQRSLGRVLITPLTISDLFAGAIIPGLLLVTLYILYQLVWGKLFPSHFPQASQDWDGLTARQSQISLLSLSKALLPAFSLILAVLGSILAGIATPTESAALGCVGAIYLASWQKAGAKLGFGSFLNRNVTIVLLAGGGLGILALMPTVIAYNGRNSFSNGLSLLAMVAIGLSLGLSLWRLGKQGILREVCQKTMELSTMIFLIVIGATCFSLVFKGFGGDEFVASLLANAPGGAQGALLMVNLVVFILGFFIEFVEITFIVVPLVAPYLLAYDTISPLWLGVLLGMNLQTSFLTPPFGFALFYLRGVAPPSVTTRTIYQGVVPFILLQMIGWALVYFFPALAEFLPKLLSGTDFHSKG